MGRESSDVRNVFAKATSAIVNENQVVSLVDDYKSLGLVRI